MIKMPGYPSCFQHADCPLKLKLIIRNCSGKFFLLIFFLVTSSPTCSHIYYCVYLFTCIFFAMVSLVCLLVYIFVYLQTWFLCTCLFTHSFFNTLSCFAGYTWHLVYMHLFTLVYREYYMVARKYEINFEC